MFLINDYIKCLEPGDVISALQAEGLPSDIVSKANSFTAQHGPHPNVGYFLITRKDYDTIASQDFDFPSSEGFDTPEEDAIPDGQYPIHKVTIVSDDLRSSVTYGKLTITNAVNIFGARDNPAAVVLIKLEDYRWWMKKFYCKNFKHNFIATNKDFGEPEYLRPNTVKENDGTYSFYTVTESLTELINSFTEQAVHPSFSYAQYDTSTDITDYLHNLEFADKTILEAISTICESMRLTFTVLPNGKIKFINTEAVWPSTQFAFCDTIDFGPSTVPATVVATTEKQDYQLYDDRCSINHPDNVYFYNYASDYFDTTAEESITVPYLVESSYLSNGAEINDILERICDRFVAIRKAAPRATYWKGYRDFYNSLGFGLEQITYSSTGKGLITVAIGKELDQMPLNYRNPPFPVYKPTPHGMWLYRFTLISEWVDGEAEASIQRHSGEQTEYQVFIKDPFLIFEDMGLDDSGWCIELCGEYYAIQAPCGAVGETPVEPSSTP